MILPSSHTFTVIFIVRFFVLFFGLLHTGDLKGQKYVLLDKHLAKPISYTDKITSDDKFNDLFPVERSLLPRFINVLEEIESRLSSKAPIDVLKEYQVGCIKFQGLILRLASEPRIAYTLTSSCDNVNISMHLSEARVSNASNSFFIESWISYVRNSIKL